MKHKLAPVPRVIQSVIPRLCRSLALIAALAAASSMASAQAVISVIASDADAAESPADHGQFLVRRENGIGIQPVTVFYDVTGTATGGADYAALSGNITLVAFQREAVIPVTVSGNDGLFEGDESVTVTLRSSTNAAVSDTPASVTIADTAHTVTASTGSNAAEDPEVPGQVLVSLGGQNQSGDAILVNYSVGGSASPGTDYAALSGVAQIPGGSSAASIDIAAVADDVIEGDETVEITLTATNNPSAPLGEPATAGVTIEDDEAVADDDADGLINIEECPEVSQCRDTDADATPDYQDPDDDGDSVPTASETAPSQDTNGDGNPDYLDDNDDGDGRLTRDEDANEDGDDNAATDPTDIDDDGIADYLDPDDQGGPTGDLDGDGLTNEREAAIGTDPEVADTDGDGVDDGDEDAASSDPLDSKAFADADGDLVPDAVEAADDTDPNNAANFLDSDSGGTADHIETITYASYGITGTDTLDSLDDRRDFDADGLPDRLEISIGGAPDSSDSPTENGAGDDTENGVSNAVEAHLAALGIEPVDAGSDFDRDGYPDVREVALLLDPLSAAAADSDGDGVPDVVELVAGVDIDAATDSDADGAPDAREIAWQADPLDANSPIANGALDDDGDGVSNAIEAVLKTLGAPADIDGGSDGDGDGLGDADEIRFGADPLHNEQPAPWIELMQADFGAVRALSTSGGQASAKAVIGGHQSGLSYDWSDTSNAVLAVTIEGQTGSALVFAPETLPAGTYSLVARVQRTAGAFTSPASVVEFTLKVVTDAAGVELADADNDGIPDASDDSDARLGSANTLPRESAAPLTAEAGVRLQLGSTAGSTEASSARVTLADIANAGDAAASSEDDFEYLGGIYDFEITNLPEPGSIVQIVVPQAAPIGEFAEYRKFLPGAGWSVFTENENNRIASAAGSSDNCPVPGDDSYQPGLTAGHFCVQLSIEDGGPNDGDADLGPNGVIKDPGGVATPEGQVIVGEGSGATAPAALVVIGTFVCWMVYRRRRTSAVSAMLLCCGLFATPFSARADSFIGGGAGLSMLDPETTGTPFSVSDDGDFGFKVFGGVDLTPISPNLSVEAFWADLGQATLDDTAAIDYSVYGAGLLYGLGSIEAPRWSGAVEVGVAQLDIGGDVPFRQEDDTSMFLSLAGSFAVRRHLFLQLEYEYFTEDAQFISLSLVKRFRTNKSSDVKTIPLPDR